MNGTNMNNTASMLIWLAILIAMIIFGPFATIWSINTLFGTTIAFTFETWLATVWLSMVTFGNVVSAVNKSKK